MREIRNVTSDVADFPCYIYDALITVRKSI